MSVRSCLIQDVSVVDVNGLLSLYVLSLSLHCIRRSRSPFYCTGGHYAYTQKYDNNCSFSINRQDSVQQRTQCTMLRGDCSRQCSVKKADAYAMSELDGPDSMGGATL